MIDFDAQKTGMNNAVWELRYYGRDGQSWAAGRKAYYQVKHLRDGSGMPLFDLISLNEQTLIGMKIVVDPTISDDTIEFLDKDNRIVGKIYNIG